MNCKCSCTIISTNAAVFTKLWFLLCMTFSGTCAFFSSSRLFPVLTRLPGYKAKSILCEEVREQTWDLTLSVTSLLKLLSPLYLPALSWLIDVSCTHFQTWLFVLAFHNLFRGKVSLMFISSLWMAYPFTDSFLWCICNVFEVSLWACCVTTLPPAAEVHATI